MQSPQSKNMHAPATQVDLETIVALAKRRGFVYPTSEIYDGLARCNY